MRYNAFLSYSHRADDQLARALQESLEQLAKPWNRRRALSIFRDESALGLTPELWPTIQKSLDNSEWLVVLISPLARSSEWVDKEITHWLSTNPGGASRILLVLTDGELRWNPDTATFDSIASTALPPALDDVFENEPLHLDLRWTRLEPSAKPLTLDHPEFRQAVADLAAPIHGVERSDIDGLAVKEERRIRRLRNGALLGLAMLAIAASVAAVFAARFASTANSAAAQAQREEERANGEADRANTEAENARTQASIARSEEDRANTEAENARTQASIARSEEDRANTEAENARTQASIARAEEDRANQEAERANEERNNAVVAREEALDRATEAELAAISFGTARANPALALAIAAEGLAVRDSLSPTLLESRAVAYDTLAVSGQSIGEPFEGHTDWLFAVAFNHDRTRLASAGQDGIRIWSLQTRRLVGEPITDQGFVNALAFNHDGTILAASGTAGISFWDPQTGDRIGRQIPLSTDRATDSLVFNRSGTVLVAGGGNASSGRIDFWDTRTGAPIEPSISYPEKVESIDLSPDGTTIASGGWDDTIRLWDFQTRRAIGRPMVGHDSDVLSVAFAEDGSTIASGSSDGTIRLWDPLTGAAIGQPISNGGTASSVDFNHDGSLLASSSGTEVRLWDPVQRVLVGQPLVGHAESITSLMFSRDGSMLASAGLDDTVRLWDPDPAQPINWPRRHSNDVDYVAFSPDGTLLAVVSSDDDVVRIWNATTGRLVRRWEGSHPSGISEVHFSRDGRFLVTVGSPRVRMWNYQTGQELPGPSIPESSSIVALNHDSTVLAVMGSFGLVRMWDLRSRQQIGEVIEARGSVLSSLVFNHDGTVLASSTGASRIELWDVKSGDLIGDLVTVDDARAESISFNHNGTLLASGGTDGNVRLWDPRTRRVRHTLSAHTSAVQAVAFNGDGSVLATAGDTTVRLWDPSTGEAIGEPFRGHRDFVRTLSFNPQGTLLASGAWDETVILRDLTASQNACEYARPYVTSGQLEAAVPGVDPVRACSDLLDRLPDPNFDYGR